MTKNMDLSKIEELRNEASNELSAAETADNLELWRIEYLGRRGRLTQILRGLGDMPPEHRRSLGAEANRLKIFLEEKLI